MDFKRWLRQTGKSERTAQSYANAISGSISDWAESYGLSTENLMLIDNINRFREISGKMQANEDFVARNTKGKGMYSAALNHFNNYLLDVTSEHVREDIEEIVSNKNIDDTVKASLVSARVGQGKYRNTLIDYWGRCALTGYGDVRFLIASHIKPWRGSDNKERLDPFNGLLLLPNVDKVFDLGFITFEDNGEIVISSHLEEPDRIGVVNNMSISLEERHRIYMAYHRERVYEKNA